MHNCIPAARNLHRPLSGAVWVCTACSLMLPALSVYIDMANRPHKANTQTDVNISFTEPKCVTGMGL